MDALREMEAEVERREAAADRLAQMAADERALIDDLRRDLDYANRRLSQLGREGR